MLINKPGRVPLNLKSKTCNSSLKSLRFSGIILLLFLFVQSIAQPINDDCSGALSLTVQPFGQTCTNPTTVTTAGATQSAAPVNACGNADNNDDVWYKFDATSAQHVFRFSGMTQLLGSPNSIGMTLYDGGPSASAACPVNATSFFCSAAWGFNSGHQLIGGFTAGNTYYIRLWTAGTQNAASFAFCVQAVPPPPANDNCTGALPLAVQPFGQTCTNAVNINTAGATASSVPAASCGGADVNDDVWLKFTATSTQHIFRFANQVQLLGSSSNIGMTLYDGGPSASATCPASATNIFCTGGFGFFNGYQLIGGFAPGNTYFIRVWAGGQQNFASFDFCVQEVPPPPANDNCSGAINLTVQPFGQTCTNAVNINTAGATASSVPAASCGGADVNDDVWLKFTATSAQHIFRFANQVQLLGSSSNLGMTLYDGGPSASATCPTTTTNIFCSGGFGFFNGYQLIGGFTPGNTYFIRIWAGGQQNFASFDFCVQEVPPPPANDDCSGAINLTVQPFGQTCTNAVSLNTAGATASTLPAASCGSAEINDDVWLKFTATSAQHIFRFANQVQLLGSSSNIGMTLYDGGPSASATCPATTTNIFCSGGFGFFNGYQLTGGFTPGNTYFIRIWAGGQQNFASFDFCVQEVPPPPANDNCSGAINLTVQPFGQTCTNAVSLNTAGATASTVPAASCGGADVNDDVWLKFTATSAQHIFRFANQVQLLGSSSNIGMTLYDGGPAASATCPATTTNIFCSGGFGFFNGYQLIGGFTPGNTYFIRVWAGGQQNFASFDFCVQEVPPSPANDDCSGAINLTVQPFGQSCTNAVNIITAGATASSVPAASCGGADVNDDVWLKFTATSAQHIFRFANQVQLLGSSSNIGMTLYDGGPSASVTCPATTTNIFCSGGFGFFNGYQLIGGFTPRNTYFIRIWAGGQQNFASFDFCVQEVPPPPANDDCSGAIPIQLQSSALSCETPITVNTAGATQSINKADCQGTNTEDDVWFSFTATSSKIRMIFSDYQQLLGSSSSLGYAIYKQTCPSGSAAFLCNNNFGFFSGKTILDGFEPGTSYLLRLWGPGNSNFISFNICIQAVIPPPNDECTTAIALTTGAGFCTQPAVINLFDATTSQGFNSAPSCRGGSRTEDVWYTATIPATGNLVVQTSPANTNVNDLVMVAYTGACNALAQIACDDNGNPEAAPAANHPQMTFTGRTPGEKITFRVVSVTEQGMGRFATCAYDTSAAVLPPVAASGACLIADSLFINESLANGYRWLPVFNQSGHIVAEVYADNHQPDTITTRLNIIPTMPLPMLDGKYYAARQINLQGKSGQIGQKVRLYIRHEEIDSLRKLDSTLAGITNLSVRSDTTLCVQGIVRQVKSYTSVWAVYGSDYRLEITPGVDFPGTKFYYFNSACGSTITWTGNKNTDWHDPANWDCGGVPYVQTRVIIPSGRARYPFILRSTEVKELDVRNNASVQVQPGVVLKVNGVSQ